MAGARDENGDAGGAAVTGRSVTAWPKRSVHNGLLLSALWDAAFDQGFISFADDGTAVASPRLSEAAIKSLCSDTARRLEGLRDAHRPNLAVHRARHGF